MKQNLTLFGRQYAPTARAAVDTLFNPDGTANGIYRVCNNGVLLRRLNGEPVAFIHRDGFAVTAHRIDGRTRYMFSTTEDTRRFLGEPESYMAAREGCADFIRQAMG